MAEIDTSDLARLVKELRVESASHFTQWNRWLCLGSAGGAIAITSLAANLPDPNYAFLFLLPSLWSFFVGVISASIGILALAKKSSALAEHYANSQNRDQYYSAAKQIPEMLSSPERLANEQNAGRNELIKKGQLENERAEHSWKLRTIWHVTWICLLIVSSAAFSFGFGWPLSQVWLGKSLVP